VTEFVPPIRRRNYGKGHGYVDANGQKMPGVTTILSKGVPKEALINWAANATADYAVNKWDDLGSMEPAARLKRLKDARYEERDAAANRGTEIHGYGERLVKGEGVKGIPDALRGYVEAYVRFLDEFDVEPVLVETVVASYKYGWAGTFDLLADLVDPTDTDGGRVRWLLDLKSNRSGIFGETALQLAGYRYCDVYLDDKGAEQPMLEVARTGAVHVRADGYSLIPTESGERQLRQLRYCQQVMKFGEESRDLIGAPIDPPTDPDAATARVVWSDQNAGVKSA